MNIKILSTSIYRLNIHNYILNMHNYILNNIIINILPKWTYGPYQCSILITPVMAVENVTTTMLSEVELVSSFF